MYHIVYGNDGKCILYDALGVRMCRTSGIYENFITKIRDS